MQSNQDQFVKRNKINLLILTISVLLLSQISFAGTRQGAVEALLIARDGRIIFAAGMHAGEPDCATENSVGTWEVSIGGTYDGGRDMLLDLLLDVQSNSQSVTVVGLNECTGGREIVYYISR